MANLLMNYRIDGRFFLISPGENQKSPIPGILKGKEWLVVDKRLRDKGGKYCRY